MEETVSFHIGGFKISISSQEPNSLRHDYPEGTMRFCVAHWKSIGLEG